MQNAFIAQIGAIRTILHFCRPTVIEKGLIEGCYSRYFAFLYFNESMNLTGLLFALFCVSVKEMLERCYFVLLGKI